MNTDALKHNKPVRHPNGFSSTGGSLTGRHNTQRFHSPDPVDCEYMRRVLIRELDDIYLFSELWEVVKEDK